MNYLIKYGISYIKSCILTFAIIPVIFAIFFTVLNFYSIDAINYLIQLLFKLHLLAPNTNHIDTGMVMNIVFKVSLFLFIVSEIFRFIFFKMTGRKINITIRYKIAVSFCTIIIIFLLAMMSLTRAKLSNESDRVSFIFLLLFFGGLSLISTLIYFAIDPLVLFLKNIIHNFSYNK